MIRALAETMLAPIVVRRKAPGGSMLVNTRVGGLRYLLRSPPDWSPELVAMAGVLVEKGDVVWDVGANLGLFSVSALAKASMVVAVEADTDAAAILARTAKLANKPLTVVSAAVSCQSGVVQFAIAKRARAANSILGFGSSQQGGVREIRTVRSITLDEMLREFPPPRVLKIDVEGAEIDVLHGAEQVLSGVRPKIYCEVAGRNQLAATAILRRYRYDLYDGKLYDGRQGRVQSATFNTVAIPA